MVAAEHLPLGDVKKRLPELVERVKSEQGRVVIMKHGEPCVIMLSLEDLESLEETLEIVSHSALMDDIREAEKDLGAGQTTAMSKEEALELAKRRYGVTHRPTPPASAAAPHKRPRPGQLGDMS